MNRAVYCFKQIFDSVILAGMIILFIGLIWKRKEQHDEESADL